MRCLTYAIRKWLSEGGYVCIRKSKHLPLPHFLHAKGLVDCTHMTASIPPGRWWQELWYVITGKNYAEKLGDDK